MSNIRLFVVGLSFLGVMVGCAADADDGEEDVGTDSEEVRASTFEPGHCQSTNGAKVLGTSCHRKADLLKVCQNMARNGEEAWRVTTSGLAQDGKWKTATCSIDMRKVNIRCCDAS